MLIMGPYSVPLPNTASNAPAPPTPAFAEMIWILVSVLCSHLLSEYSTIALSVAPVIAPPST